MLLKKLVMRDGKSRLSDHMLASVEQAKEEAASILRTFFKNEEESIFLDLFEDEVREIRRRKLNVEYLMMDANLLLPPNQLTSLMMNGVDFTRRLPCADVERTRYVSTTASLSSPSPHHLICHSMIHCSRFPRASSRLTSIFFLFLLPSLS